MATYILLIFINAKKNTSHPKYANSDNIILSKLKQAKVKILGWTAQPHLSTLCLSRERISVQKDVAHHGLFVLTFNFKCILSSEQESKGKGGESGQC